MLAGYRVWIDMLLKNSDKSVNFRYVFLPLVSRLTASGSLLSEGWRCGWAYFGPAWGVWVCGFL